MKSRLAVVMLVTACSSGPNKLKDAAIDAVPDAAWVLYTGEYVDWDSSNTTFCGIFDATFQVHGEPSRVDHTNPNGRFMLNVQPDAPTRIDITPPTAQSECLQPTSTYTMPGLTMADPAVIATGQIFSMRNFSELARMNIVNNYGPLDPQKGHVFVHVDGNQRVVSLSLASSVQLAYDGTKWATGDTGVNVFFMNVPTGNTLVQMTSATGVGMVPVEAGTITYVTLVGN